MLYKSFEVKSDAGAGSISGYFATYDRIPDSYGDVIAEGAFTDTIKAREESGHPFPLCWNHDLDQIIGRVEKIEDTEKGPLMTASFFDTPLAQEKRELVKEGIVWQFSFAYNIIESEAPTADEKKAGIMQKLTKLDLFEVSLVPVPANQTAIVTEIKSEAEEPETKDGEPEVKAGRRNSKKDADAIREAITLLQGVLGELEDINDEGKDDAKANGSAPEEQKQSNPEIEELMKRTNEILRRNQK
jgi:HK97 family phage prohead protease